MSEFNFNIEEGTNLKLNTAGKYCADDIIIKASDKNFTGILDGTIQELKSDLEEIRAYGCYSCKSLVSIDLPNVTTIGSYAFYLTKITDLYLPSVTKIQDYAFRFCTTLTSIQLPKVTYLGSSVFESCSNLVSVDCPLLVTPGNGGFRYCENLQNVNLPKATIFNSTFTDCTSLKTIALPSAKTIGGSAFENCTSLEYVDFSGCTAVPKMSNIDAFEGVPTTCQIRVPASLLEQWKTAKNWSTYAAQIVAAE